MGVHVSFLMVDHVQNQSIFLIAEKYVYVGKCFGYLYPISSLVVPTISILKKSHSAPVSEFSVVFQPDQSWAIALVISKRQNDCYSKLSGSES